ncbi:MAG: hypothetical protein JNL33_00215 [Betaproteobacteria bacterium]|nr:hypothetical protein [Betaproteobacteria bacterium]
MKTSAPFRPIAIAVLAGSTLGLAACGVAPGGNVTLTERDTARLNPVLQTLTEPERVAFKRLYLEGERNAALNFQTLGVAAMEANHFAIAERAFDEAVQRIERFYTNDANAQKAKSTFTAESIKDFKGEPYERAMAFYYRGLLYLRAGDYQNARASFLKADYQDTVAEKEAYQGDFGVMNYLAGWASSCDGDVAKGRDLIEAGARKDANVAALPVEARPLVIVESGSGPIKVGSGKHRELLTIQERPASADEPLTVNPVADGIGRFVKVADIVYQGTTRGGRPIQGILDGKAQFKDSAQAVGEVGVTTGVAVMQSGALSNNADMMNAGAVVGLLGMVATLASEAAKPAADTRYWPNLPRDIYVSATGAGDLPETGLDVRYRKPDGSEHSLQAQTWRAAGPCGIAWGRTRPTPQTADQRPLEGSRSPKDEQFRQRIVDEFRIGEEKA